MGFLQRGADVLGGERIDTIQDSFQVALNDVKRCAKFVGDVGGQVAALLLGALQLTQHMIETPGQLLKLG